MRLGYGGMISKRTFTYTLWLEIEAMGYGVAWVKKIVFYLVPLIIHTESILQFHLYGCDTLHIR